MARRQNNQMPWFLDEDTTKTTTKMKTKMKMKMSNDDGWVEEKLCVGCS